MHVPDSDSGSQQPRPVPQRMTTLQRLLAQARERSMTSKVNQPAQPSHPQKNFSLPRPNSNPALRQENLWLFRAYMKTSQEECARMLRIGGQKTYSTIETGQSELEDRQATRIESELALADGWFDRNNAAMLFITNDEFLLIQEVRKSGLQAAVSVAEMLKNIRVRGGH